MGGAKRILDHHEVSLKAPVLRAARILQDNIPILAREGVEAYAAAIVADAEAHASHHVTERIILAVADELGGP